MRNPLKWRPLRQRETGTIMSEAQELQRLIAEKVERRKQAWLQRQRLGGVPRFARRHMTKAVLDTVVQGRGTRRQRKIVAKTHRMLARRAGVR